MRDYNKFSDHELWDLIKQNDLKAFNKLYDRFWSKMFITAFSYVKDRELCIEVTNDILLNLWIKRNHLKIDSFGTYLTACSRYHIYRKLKALKSSPLKLVENYETVIQKENHVNDGENRLLFNELEKKTESHLLNLPKRCREVFVMSRKEFLSNDEIAIHFNISKRTVENQITAALKHLRIYLKAV